jgi:hypothetical protein
MFLVLDASWIIQDIRPTSRAVDIFAASLRASVSGGLAFVAAIEGQIILVTSVFTLIFVGQIHKRAPFSRLIGLCHLPWLVLLPGLYIDCRA